MTGKPQRALRAPRINFEVTAAVIAASTPKDSAHCMIADALKLAMPNAAYISVDLATIRFTDKLAGLRYIYLTPRSAQAALIAFDQGEKPAPFKVTAMASQMVKTGIARRAPKVKTGEPTGRQRIYEKPELIPSGAGGSTVPIKTGGKVPPVGPLAKGATGKRPSGTSRRREFGIRALVR